VGPNPFFSLCSPDTVLRRLKSLAVEDRVCQTPRGLVEHQYNYNEKLANVNIRLLKLLGQFDKQELVIDYDNTILFTEKMDSKMTYKRDYGYQPGVCFLNHKYALYMENRNGNSDAKSFQVDTLYRMFQHLEEQRVNKIDKFRADSASYQFEVIKLLEQHVQHFYIGLRNSYVEKYFSQITEWKETKDSLGDTIWIGEIMYTPFEKKNREGLSPYRLLVKRKLRKDAQANLFTSDAYDYRAVITNDMECQAEQGLTFYYQRGDVERQFDILKNDFGWNYPPYSQLANNNVFLYITAMCRSLYAHVLDKLSNTYRNVNSRMRMKRFIFSFITLPAKWVLKARQWQLRIYGSIQLRI
jgi:hypothetical protein